MKLRVRILLSCSSSVIVLAATMVLSSSLFAQTITREQWDNYMSYKKELGSHLHISGHNASRVEGETAVYITSLVHNRHESWEAKGFNMQCDIRGRDVLLYRGFVSVQESSPIPPGEVKRVSLSLLPRPGDYVRSPMVRDERYNYYLKPGVPSAGFEDGEHIFSEMANHRPSNIAVSCKDVVAD